MAFSGSGCFGGEEIPGDHQVFYGASGQGEVDLQQARPGLESADPKTLSAIKKPITAEMVDEAFARMLEINRKYEKIEITGNFVFGDNLPPSHLASFMALTEKRLARPYSKGAIYFSPLVNGGVEANRGMIRKFYKIKTMSPLPTFIYLIQRL